MNPEKIELCLEVLSAIAWADADLCVEEIAHAVDLLEPMAYGPRHRIEEIFMLPCCLPSPARLQMLSTDERARLILDARHVAEVLRGIEAEELALLHALDAALNAPDQPDKRPD